jgi:SEC-C motif-containing protein
MRSRYTAFVLGELEYLRLTWHEDFRPQRVDAEPGIRWIGLEILDETRHEGAATVEFEARLLRGGIVDALHERSEFLRLQGRWYYTRGALLPPSFAPWKPGRNEACPCGSGRKFKRCCAGSFAPQTG